jgi:hypothetical protein
MDGEGAGLQSVSLSQFRDPDFLIVVACARQDAQPAVEVTPLKSHLILSQLTRTASPTDTPEPQWVKKTSLFKRL